MNRIALRLTTLFIVSMGAAAAQPGIDADAERGRRFVESSCTRCHAVGPSGISPNREAPPLRDLHRRYPVDGLEEAFAEGIQVGHPDMPQFVLEPQQIRDLLAYLKSIDPCRKPGSDAAAMKACFDTVER